jgi:hypothetical protein
MTWVRRYVRRGAGVALLALALQLVLSFGHVHLDGLAGSGPAQAGISVSATANDAGTPSDTGHHPGANDFCAICATISLAGSLLLPQLAHLVLPAVTAREWSPDDRTALAPGAPHRHFQARAPPVFS